LQHIVLRGTDPRPIVRDDLDQAERLFFLQRTMESYGWRLNQVGSGWWLVDEYDYEHGRPSRVLWRSGSP
jgi:hypothetical protein